MKEEGREEVREYRKGGKGEGKGVDCRVGHGLDSSMD